jgi:hypothetical protein
MRDILHMRPAELSLEELRECHRMLWDFLATHVNTGKVDFFKAHDIAEPEHRPDNYCYACEAAEKIKAYGSGISCYYCPCIWPEVDSRLTGAPCERSYYGIWGACLADHQEAAIKVRDAWPEY